MSEDARGRMAERIAEIEARTLAATPGPWTEEKPAGGPVFGFAPGMIVAATGPKQAIYANPPGGSYPANDRRFIAHARADVPWLLAQLRSAQAELEITIKERETAGAAAVKARALAHQAIGCECAMLSGKHDEICDRVTAALASARNEALEEALTTIKPLMKHHLWAKQAIPLWAELEPAIRALKDRP